MQDKEAVTRPVALDGQATATMIDDRLAELVRQGLALACSQAAEKTGAAGRWEALQSAKGAHDDDRCDNEQLAQTLRLLDAFEAAIDRGRWTEPPLIPAFASLVRPIVLSYAREEGSMDITSVTAAVEGLRFARDALKGLLNLKIDAASLARINEAMGTVADAQQRLLDMRQAMFDMQTENAQLKQAIAAHDDWKARLDNYALVTTRGGAKVLASKSGESHYICPSCVNKREIHPLQDLQADSGSWKCTGCKSLYSVDSYSEPPPIMYSRTGY